MILSMLRAHFRATKSALNLYCADEFYLDFEEGGIKRCATGRMTLNSAAAQACLKKPDVDNMSPVPSRKRSASSSSASGERSSQLPARKRRKASSSPRAAATIEAEEDVPPPQRALFEGYTFLLTQRPKDDKQCTDSPPPEPVDRALIGSQLRNRRGRVLDSYGRERIISNRFDTYCRTSKYLMGLALGVPPLSYTWVAECIRRTKVFRASIFCQSVRADVRIFWACSRMVFLLPTCRSST